MKWLVLTHVVGIHFGPPPSRGEKRKKRCHEDTCTSDEGCHAQNWSRAFEARSHLLCYTSADAEFRRIPQDGKILSGYRQSKAGTKATCWRLFVPKDSARRLNCIVKGSLEETSELRQMKLASTREIKEMWYPQGMKWKRWDVKQMRAKVSWRTKCRVLQ